MTQSPGDRDRQQRVHKLRATWRADEPPQDEPEGAGEDRAQRTEDALDMNDRIRGEAPDDLETRRRADQLEREIRGSGNR